MICDDCIKKEVCRFKDEAKCYEETVKTIMQDSTAPFSTSIQCKHRDTRATIRTPLTLPQQPLTPGTYPYSPSMPWDKRITWDGRPEITCDSGKTE